jgi:ferredoxin
MRAGLSLYAFEAAEVFAGCGHIAPDLFEEADDATVGGLRFTDGCVRYRSSRIGTNDTDLARGGRRRGVFWVAGQVHELRVGNLEDAAQTMQDAWRRCPNEPSLQLELVRGRDAGPVGSGLHRQPSALSSVTDGFAELKGGSGWGSLGGMLLAGHAEALRRCHSP